MRAVLFSALLSVMALSAPAQEPVWHTNVMQAVDISLAQKKPLLLFFTGSDWCGWCVRLQNEVFRTPEFEKWAAKHVVLVELDYPRRKQLSPEISQQNNEFQRIFQVRGYPTIHLVRPTKQEANVNFDSMGTTGYVAGGPQAWIAEAGKLLANKPQ